MQDKAIAAIGRWQLNEKRGIEPVDLYIENMFPGKNWQMLLLEFEVTKSNDGTKCLYKRIDIENVSSDNDSYKKYAYRKGSARGGDVTFSTKLGYPVDKKLNAIKENTFKNLFALKKDFPEEAAVFEALKKSFLINEDRIKDELNDLFESFDRKQAVTTGLSFKLIVNGEEKYLRDFGIIRQMILRAAEVTNYTHAGTESKANNKISSVSGTRQQKIYGFDAPFKYASPDKPGFISGFFNKKMNWRNYPIGANETLELELGRKFVQQNLSGYFYGHEYMMVPNPLIQTEQESLRKIISLLRTAFDEEKKARKERKRSAEDRILKLIAAEKNYFNLDILFFKEDKKTGAITIELMLEEILPSRFRQLFIDAPEKINKNNLFKSAINIKNEREDLRFTYQIIKDFFDSRFLDVVNIIFMGQPLSREFFFENVMALIRKKYNESKTGDGFVEPTRWLVLKAIMLFYYLLELKILDNNQNFNYMETENNQKQSTFNLERFNEFVRENKAFLDSELKIGIFAVGVLVRFLFDIQNANLQNTPFENKLRGYKLNPELLKNIYTEALDKIQKYQNFYTYQELRDIISKHFVVRTGELKKMSNQELSFYFVAGLELGKEFKREKENQ